MAQEVLKLHLNSGTLERLRARKELTLVPTSAAVRALIEGWLDATPTTSAATLSPRAAAPTTPQIKALTRATIAESLKEPSRIDVTLSKSSDLAENENRIEVKLNDDDADKLSQMGRRVDESSAELVVRAVRALLAGLVPDTGAVVKPKFDPSKVVLKDLPKDFDFDAEQQRLDLEDAQSEGRANIKAEPPPGTPPATLSGSVENTPKQGFYEPKPVLDDDGVPVPDPFAHAGPDPHLVAMAAERAAWEKLGANKE